MFIFRHQNVGHNYNIKAANKSSENVAKFTSLHLGTTITTQKIAFMKKLGPCSIPGMLATFRLSRNVVIIIIIIIIIIKPTETCHGYYKTESLNRFIDLSKLPFPLVKGKAIP
jgi:hypothetical protein